MAITRIIVTDPADLAHRIGSAIHREGRFAVPRAQRKGSARMSLSDCQYMGSLVAKQLISDGLIEAVFQTYDGRSVQSGHTGLVPSKAEEGNESN